jgi:ArsR family transcriptional regulator
MDSLSDPIRLRLLRLLERNELGVVDLCDVLQLPQSTVSRHLKVLTDQGWTRSTRQGTAHLYRMTLDELETPTRKLWLIAREQTESWTAIEQDQLRLTRLLAERQRDSQTFFAGAAGQWDKIRTEYYGNGFVTPAMLALLPRNLTVCDLGCGTGEVLELLAPHVHHAIGIDNSSAMLRAAKRRLESVPNIELRQGDLESLPMSDESVDAAMLQLVLSYVADPHRVLKEMARVVKGGGSAVVVDLLAHDREDVRRQLGQRCLGFDPASIESLLRAAGFGQITVKPLPPEPSVKGPALFLARGVR